MIGLKDFFLHEIGYYPFVSVILLTFSFDLFRVLVMSNGEVLEFDDPSALMENHESHFYQLARGNM